MNSNIVFLRKRRLTRHNTTFNIFLGGLSIVNTRWFEKYYKGGKDSLFDKDCLYIWWYLCSSWKIYFGPFQLLLHRVFRHDRDKMRLYISALVVYLLIHNQHGFASWIVELIELGSSSWCKNRYSVTHATSMYNFSILAEYKIDITQILKII